MKGKRRTGQFQARGNGAGRKPLGSVGDQQPKDVEARFLRKSGE